ncbi:hypothetical protein GYMLUDRAFT_138133, partial [Collybiopsis luxurians FD-317 M1]
VPNIRQVVSGAHVSIILKIDQPTGRQVQGTVAEVLTSGDHPRGIKVRLVDGRVGRVQRMVTEEEARVGSEGLRNLGRNGEPIRSASMLMRNPRHREEQGISAPSGFTLDDFFPPESSLPCEETQNSSGHIPEIIPHPAIQTCPVCYEFEGDELAVAHHVNSHFD